MPHTRRSWYRKGYTGLGVANADQIILNLERLKQIRDIDPANTMTVEAWSNRNFKRPHVTPGFFRSAWQQKAVAKSAGTLRPMQAA